MKWSNSPIIFLSKKLWKFSKGNRRSVVMYGVLFFIGNAASFFIPLVIGHLLNVIQQSGLTPESFPKIVQSLGWLFAIDVAFWAFHGPGRLIETKNAFIVRKNFKQYLLDGVLELPPAWHTDHHSGDTIDKIEKATEGMFNYSSRTFEVIELILRFLFSYAALVYFDINSLYIVLVMTVITLGMLSYFDKKLVKQWRDLYLFENKISAKIFDVISNITTVIILRVEKLVLKSIVQKIIQPFELYKKSNRVNEAKWFLSSVCQTTTMVLILGAYLYHQYLLGSVILVGSVFAMYGYITRIEETFFRFAYLYNELLQYRTAVQNVDTISNLFVKKSGADQFQLGKKWKVLTIFGLQFSYGGKKRERKQLNNISLTIQHGQKIALIGDSGAGKTTFLKIFRGLYNPQKAKLAVDDMPLTLGFQSISDEISLIPQDPEIFATTIKENITIGVPHNMSYIERFVGMAQFTNVVKRLPKGYDSSVVEKGVNLSGGEKQRLALARGLLASAGKSILLFDEPTSSVDTKNELIIYRNIFAEYKDKTIISTIHRLHLLPLFDRIILFEEGKVVADGSFGELLEQSAVFKQLWKTYQFTQQTQEKIDKNS